MTAAASLLESYGQQSLPDIDRATCQVLRAEIIQMAAAVDRPELPVNGWLEIQEFTPGVDLEPRTVAFYFNEMRWWKRCRNGDLMINYEDHYVLVPNHVIYRLIVHRNVDA